MPVFDLSIIVFTLLTGFFDFTVRKIPNWLILFGLTNAIAFNAIQGLPQLSESVLGFTIGIAVLFVPFALGWVGAGDVKCFGVAGAFLGLPWLPRIAFYTALAAGTVALGHVMLNGFRAYSFKAILTDFQLAITSFGHILPDPITTKIDKRSQGVPLGAAIGAGTIIAYYLDPRGRWAGF
jgi:prepilin peptidase CpaA